MTAGFFWFFFLNNLLILSSHCSMEVREGSENNPRLKPPDNESLICFQSLAQENTQPHPVTRGWGRWSPYDWTLSRGDPGNRDISKHMHRDNWSMCFYWSQGTLLKHSDLDLFSVILNLKPLRSWINVTHLFKLLALSYTSSKITIVTVRKSFIVWLLAVLWMWEWE